MELLNAKDIAVVLDVRRYFTGNWQLSTDAVYEKVDATKVKFVRPLQPHEKFAFSYQLTTRHGINVAK